MSLRLCTLHTYKFTLHTLLCTEGVQYSKVTVECSIYFCNLVAQKRREFVEHVTITPAPAPVESCERHCERTRNAFGCVLNGTRAIGSFISEPTERKLNTAGCRCLDVTLLCDRVAQCVNGSDEEADTCAKWNASKSCRSSDFMCTTGLAVDPQPGRRPFCIPKAARCDSHVDCDDRSDELNCEIRPPQLRTHTGTSCSHSSLLVWLPLFNASIHTHKIDRMYWFDCFYK